MEGVTTSAHWGLEQLFVDNPESAAWQVMLTPLQRLSSAIKGSAATGKPSISCILGKKRVIWSLHVSPPPDCSAPADPSPALQCCFVPVLPKMLPSASQPSWFPWHRTGGNKIKRGELQKILKQCKEYSKTKGLERMRYFHNVREIFQKIPWKLIILGHASGYFQI